ncbi:class I SAM-dependent methyltransferase [Variovorax dokdonensis]|uniref:Class I SAM-dependent methyltransferase n=1 Tax=Variovorax dokdonensis TaxID=344883 RepID=A0ABT7NB42_9BURK|nr:class I SAM-dependent methyltransferase [Variovorax dokdonensis]MDM0045149.1 class I SAM-dependent methyltransferase [Variovorax dokdonensis]
MNTHDQQFTENIIETIGWGRTLVFGVDEYQTNSIATYLRISGLEATVGSIRDDLEAEPSAGGTEIKSGRVRFESVVCDDYLDSLSLSALDNALSNLVDLVGKNLILRVGHRSQRVGEAAERDRSYWEKRLIKLGLRKHPRYYYAIDYNALELESKGSSITIVMERPPSRLTEEFPLAALAEERDLHMDMMREQGRRSDAHMIRYHKAAAFIREGDRVLDAACGLGYGSHILAANSLAGSIIGIDGSDYAIRYARTAFPGEDAPTFQVGFLPQALKQFDDGTIDFIVSFETLEHLEDPLSFLKECHRVLSPSGRIMTCVPNDWSEADGVDPNPFHFHVYDWGKFHAQLSSYFLLERAFLQTASRKKIAGRWHVSPREWTEVQTSLQPDSEWCVSLAMKSPVLSSRSTVDRAISPYTLNKHLPPYVDFNGQYKNPWLIRGMVSIGLRMGNEEVLCQVAKDIELADSDKADGDAAACILAYAWLSDENYQETPTSLIGMINGHLARLQREPSTPINIRWKVSLLYVSAQIHIATGNRGEAAQFLAKCIGEPYQDYSILLGVKVASAALQLGVMRASDGDLNGARDAWREGLMVGRAATSLDWLREFGEELQLPDFVLRELTSLFDVVTQCATALNTINKLPARPYAIERIKENKSNRIIELTRSDLNNTRSLNSMRIELQEVRASLEQERQEVQKLKYCIHRMKQILGDSAKNSIHE